MKKHITLFLSTILLGALGAAAGELGAENGVEESMAVSNYVLDNLFLFICALLVIFMQPGFAILEAGLNAAKNTVNILFKNVMDLCLGALLFFVVGYSIMYGDALLGGWIGWGGFGIESEMKETAGAGILHPQIDWFFQVAFAATAATIVSGAVAGRMKFASYLIYSAVLTALVYPISGFWTWGGGWLDALGFHDFAGSAIVHAVGGFAGLAGALALGPRIGRFGVDGKPRAMPGHNLTFAALGVFILWFGWFGFNPGSQLAISGVGDLDAVAKVAVNPILAAAAGGVFAMIATWVAFGKPELSMALNGVLAGLVGITANCDLVSNPSAMVIGAIAGLLVVGGVNLLDRLRIDDPVGAWPVHGLCGLWGVLAAGIFSEEASLGVQALGGFAIAAWAFAAMSILFLILKAVGVLRVGADEELRGLDIGEHGEEAYSGFQVFSTQ